MITLPNVDPLMIANNLKSFEPTHPGQLLGDELDEREITRDEFARQIGVSSTSLDEVINGKRVVNTDLALLLEAALGIPTHIWLDLQTENEPIHNA
jgi:addiction module HigA family antidote